LSSDSDTDLDSAASCSAGTDLERVNYLTSVFELESETRAAESEDDEACMPKSDAVTPPPEMVQIVASIQDIVQQLYKLTITIRRPLPRNAMDKSASLDVSHYVAFDTVHVEQRFPFAKPKLKQCLAEAITRRRRLLLYWEHRHQALASQSLDKGVDKDVRLIDDVPDTPSQVQDTDDNQEPYLDPAKNAEDQDAVGFTSNYPLSTKATTFVPPNSPRIGTPDDQGSVTITESSYMSVMGDDDIAIPPCPEDLSQSYPATFECPLCFYILEIRTDRQWRYGNVIVHFLKSN